MFATIRSKFAEAVAKGSLIYNPPKEIKVKTTNGLQTATSIVTGLAKKPTKTEQPKESSQTPQSPWLPVEEDLYICDYEGNYQVVLNKFAVTKYHFLLVTKEFVSQNSPLSPQDWQAALKLVKQAEEESGKRHLGFFNCGPNSGASIAHRHIQFMELPENFTPFPDTTPGLAGSGEVVSDSRVPFCHYLASIPSDADEEVLAVIYSALLGQLATKCAANDVPLSYNLVFTSKWILATPRSKDKTESGLNINSLGTVGILLAQNEDQAKEIETNGLELITDIAFSYAEIPKFQLEGGNHIQYF